MKLQNLFGVLMGVACGPVSAVEAGELILAERGKPAAYTIVLGTAAGANRM